MALSTFYYSSGDPTNSTDTVITQGSYNRALTLISANIGSGVTRIETAAFYESRLTGITIPNSVTSIGGSAFYNCTFLTQANIPSGITTINYSTFERCRFSTITIPNTVTSIDDYGFYHCDAVQSVTIPDSVTSIGNSAFFYNYSAKTITLGSGLKTIGSSAFQQCGNFSGITIPSGVTSIGSAPFSQCSSLTGFNVDPSNLNYASVDGVLFNKSQTELIQYPLKKNVISYTVPNTVTIVRENSFQSAPNLSGINIGNSVSSIGFKAFYNCTKLTGALIIPDSVTSIGGRAFESCSLVTNLTVGKSVTDIGESAFSSCSRIIRADFLGSLPNVAGNIFTSSNANLKIYRKKNFVIGWTSTFEGKPVFIYADNVIKGGGTGKLIIKKRNIS
jgi:hypothetical protein